MSTAPAQHSVPSPATPPRRPTDAPRWFTDALATRAETHSTTVDGARVAYRVWDRRHAPEPHTPAPAALEPHGADGTARRADPTSGILLVHGGGAHSHWWDHIAPQLATRLRVAAVDLTGHGDSDTREHYALHQWADEVFAVTGAADLGPRPVIVGHSMGGMVTYIAAQEHGGRLGGVQIIDSPIRQRTPEEESTRRTPLGGAKKVYRTVDEALDHFHLVPSQPVVLPYIKRHVGETSLMEVPGGYSWKFDARIVGRDPSEALGAGPPACHLAYFRAEDGIISDTHFEQMRQRFGPRALVAQLPHSGHHPMADQPLMLVAVIRAALAARDAVHA